MLLVIPGPTILTVISYSVSNGRRANVPLVAAVALGDSTALALSLLGLAVLLAASALWFTAVKLIGGLYLLYLGAKLLRTGISSNELPVPNARDSGWNLFVSTYLVTAMNPKGIMFFVAFLPQFIHPSVSDTSQRWMLVVTFLVLTIVNATLYVMFAGSACRVLSSPNARRGLDITGGSLLSAAGIWTLLARRPV
jgi:threonine/homoserine/homoserine lactone efflux protein